MKVVYTATRTVSSRGRETMWQFLEEKENDGVKPIEFISGAAVGGDTFLCIASIILWPEATHRICIPDYTHNEMLVDILGVLQQKPIVDLHILIEYTHLQPLERNDYMLDKGGDDYELWAFPSTEVEQKRGSGTWACIRHNWKRDMPSQITPLNGKPYVTQPT